jgi:hypothetical protein
MRPFKVLYYQRRLMFITGVRKQVIVHLAEPTGV